jgi:esterase/lipase superfamily enzyme
VHFAWPSAARSQSYALDRESALFSRPALETTLTALAQSDTDEITLIAHSMGAFLLMDTLSAMARGGNDALFRKLHAVVLISPDLEVDLFRQQAPVILARRTQIVVLVSRGDRALEISSFIHRESDRLGDIRSVDELGGLDVTVIDISAVRSEDLLGHFKEATSPALISFVQGLHGTGLEALVEDQQMGLGERGAALIQKGAAIISAPLAGQ